MNIEEAIKYIKNDIECDKDTRDWFNDKNNPTRKQIEESIDAYETLLTAYEKQQKEIEELKEKNNKLMEELDLTTVYITGVYDGEKKVEDKIKAKIEEVKDGAYDAKIVLQSLLEKE